MKAKQEARFGLKAHQVFWNEHGEIKCACCALPYPDSDTWRDERWEEITPEIAHEIDLAGGHSACRCGKEPRRLVHA